MKNIKSKIAWINFWSAYIGDFLWLKIGKLLGRFIYPIHLIFKPKQYISRPSYFPECELKSKTLIFVQQLLFILKTGEINEHFFVFGFDKKNKNDFKNYVPWYLFTHKRHIKNERSAKPVYSYYNYVCLLRDKFVFEAFCKSTGINTPSNIGMINNGELYLIDEKKFTTLENITNLEIDAFCKKNVISGGGQPHDILKLQIKKKELSVNGKKIDVLTLKKLIGNGIWILQERIKNQSPEFAKFHSDSVNTIRIVTIKNNLKIVVLCSFFRIGVNGSFVDNTTAGGIAVGINKDNGVLEKWGFQTSGYGLKTDKHPNSEITFEGYTLPYWNDIVKYVKNAHKLFYGIHSIGWDVAITDDGIMIIEGNDNWNTLGAQLYQGARTEFEKYFK